MVERLGAPPFEVVLVRDVFQAVQLKRDIFSTIDRIASLVSEQSLVVDSDRRSRQSSLSNRSHLPSGAHAESGHFESAVRDANRPHQSLDDHGESSGADAEECNRNVDDGNGMLTSGSDRALSDDDHGEGVFNEDRSADGYVVDGDMDGMGDFRIGDGNGNNGFQNQYRAVDYRDRSHGADLSNSTVSMSFNSCEVGLLYFSLHCTASHSFACISLDKICDKMIQSPHLEWTRSRPLACLTTVARREGFISHFQEFVFRPS